MRPTCRFPWLISLAAMVLLLAGCTGSSARTPSFGAESGKLRVAASFYPIYEFTRAIGGDRIDLVNMVPSGTEPHDWEPTARHIKTLNQASIFIYSGAGMEPWVQKALRSLDNSALIAVEASRGVILLQGIEGSDDHDDEDQKDEEHKDNDNKDNDHDDADHNWDPHVWLNPLNVVQQVEMIRSALIQADPLNRDFYEANATSYIGKLKALDQEFRQLSACSQNRFFTSHAAFNYLADRYGLEQHAIMGLSPSAEPKPKALVRLVQEARASGVRHIFFETLVSDKVARVVAEEIGAQTLVLNPFEGLTALEIQAGKDYFVVMRENLANLKIALECGS